MKYLRSRQRRGRWFHYYRRNGREHSLHVHGLQPDAPKVLLAYAIQHERYNQGREEESAATGSFAWAVEAYQQSKQWEALATETRRQRTAIYVRYIKAQGERPISTISQDDLERALYKKGGFAAIGDLKALRPIFAHLKKMGYLQRDPAAGIKLEKPKTKGFPTADARDIEVFQKHWPVGTSERDIFDLALYTGAARVDLTAIGPPNLKGGLLAYDRQKTGVRAEIPVTPELQAVLDRLPDIAPAFLLTAYGRTYSPGGLGTKFGEAAKACGMVARIHGLRKAFCVYWAEKGATTHQIAAMAGHLTLAEVERYTKAADRSRLVKLLIG